MQTIDFPPQSLDFFFSVVALGNKTQSPSTSRLNDEALTGGNKQRQTVGRLPLFDLFSFLLLPWICLLVFPVAQSPLTAQQIAKEIDEGGHRKDRDSNLPT